MVENLLGYCKLLTTSRCGLVLYFENLLVILFSALVLDFDDPKHVGYSQLCSMLGWKLDFYCAFITLRAMSCLAQPL